MTEKEKKLLALFRELNRALKGIATELSVLNHHYKTPDGFREFEKALVEFEKSLKPRALPKGRPPGH